MIAIQTVVVNKANGKRGVAVHDPFGCCSPEETMVFTEGDNHDIGILTEDLDVIGPENAEATAAGCIRRGGADACIFGAVGPKGLECHRFSGLRTTLIFKSRSMHAKRNPKLLYPKCHTEGQV